MRWPLRSIRSITPIAFSSMPKWRSSAVPVRIEVSGVRTSWPSTAMNCSRSSDASRTLSRADSLCCRRCSSCSWREIRSANKHQRVDHFRVRDGRRQRVERAQGAEKLAARTVHRHRDVAFEAVHFRRRMVAVGGVRAGLVHHDRLVGGAHFAAQGGGDVERVAGLQAEADLVVHGAGGPGTGVDAGDADEAHAGGFGHHAQDGRHGADGLHRIDVGGSQIFHWRRSECQANLTPLFAGAIAQLKRRGWPPASRDLPWETFASCTIAARIFQHARRGPPPSHYA